MWIAIFIVVFFQFCLIVRQNRMETEYNHRLFKMECLNGISPSRPYDARDVIPLPRWDGRGRAC